MCTQDAAAHHPRDLREGLEERHGNDEGEALAKRIGKESRCMQSETAYKRSGAIMRRLRVEVA
jgi:hypothetical protein